MAGPPPHMWYVKAAGRAWGPYPEARVAGFVREGRVNAATPVSPFPAGPFAPAGEHPEFAPLLHALADAPPAPAVRPAPQPQRQPAYAQPAPIPAGPAQPEPAAPIAPAAAYEPEPIAPGAPEPAPRAAPEPAAAMLAGGGPVRTLLVWAELSADTLRAFPSALAAFGPGVAVRQGLWLVQVRMAPSALRNLLSRRLGPHDSLLVVEAGIDQAAWFNLEPGRDRELRRLWVQGAPV